MTDIDLDYLTSRDNWWSRVEIGAADECWNWKLSVGSHGYGTATVGRGRRQTTAHRVAYSLRVGPIPEGMTIDHVCRNRRCCNPSHMRLMTNVANASLNGNAIKTHCKRGHEFTAENTERTAHGHRRCRECMRLRNWARAQRPNAARGRTRIPG